MKSICYSLLLIFLFCCQPVNKRLSNIVQISNGKISGNYNRKTGVHSFKGIPFAKPPVGNLRWRAPLPPNSWNGILECKNFAASAMQSKPEPFSMWTCEFIAPATPLSEDCLYLNIWTGAQSENDKRPVIVFIHGGGFVAGAGSVPVYDGEEMAKVGVVFVTINYRLGIFGFLSHPELTKESPDHSSGNYGLLDQIESLKWIQKNIAAFGGDPDNVTIAGQSAGAVSINYLMVSDLTKGLFQRVIAESGGAIIGNNRFSKAINLSTAEQKGLEVARSLNAPTINDLRKIPPETLLKVQLETKPIIDGYIIKDNLKNLYSKRIQNDVPLLIGWNANEGNFVGPLLNSPLFIQKIKNEYGPLTDKFLEFFPATSDSVSTESQLEYSSLMVVGLQVITWMELKNNKGSSDVFLYYFNRKVPYGAGQEDYRAFHSSELAYAYHNLSRVDTRPWTNIDYKLEQVMSGYWINFAKNGNPNGVGLPTWQPCLSPTFNTMILGDSQKLSPFPNRAKLEFLQNFFDSK